VISNSSLRFMVFRAVTPELDRELRPRLPLEKKLRHSAKISEGNSFLLVCDYTLVSTLILHDSTLHRI
jgi:hypothetical protein